MGDNQLAGRHIQTGRHFADDILKFISWAKTDFDNPTPVFFQKFQLTITYRW